MTNDFYLPDYPRTRHLPWKPNASRNDLIASENEAKIIFSSTYIDVTEKVDGANVGICHTKEAPIIRNRNHFLNKAMVANTPAKKQFSSIWNWYYENQQKFEKLEDIWGDTISVYGEWLFAVHSVQYDKLPEYFIAYDLFDPLKQKFVDPAKAIKMLQEAGFNTVPQLLVNTPINSYEQLEKMAHEQSIFCKNQKREGIYIKVSDGEWITNRFKMVRKDFIQGEHWNKTQLKKNQLER